MLRARSFYMDTNNLERARRRGHSTAAAAANGWPHAKNTGDDAISQSCSPARFVCLFSGSRSTKARNKDTTGHTTRGLLSLSLQPSYSYESKKNTAAKRRKEAPWARAHTHNKNKKKAKRKISSRANTTFRTNESTTSTYLRRT